MSAILSAHNWNTNADLILDAVELKYLRLRWHTLDPTYGGGKWWTKWRPRSLVTHDLELDGVDFRRLPEEDETFDAVTFDPPYVCTGGRDTSTLTDFNKRYGLKGAPRTPKLLQQMINEGLEDCVRVLKRRQRGQSNGILLVKCCDYVSSGHKWNGTYLTEKHAVEELGLVRVDRFEHYTTAPRAQPKGRTRKCSRCNGSTTGCEACYEGRVPTEQEHAACNSSTLFVFVKK